MSIFFVPQRCAIKTEALPSVRRTEAAEEPLRDFDGESGIEDAASREFSSCHMTLTERFAARLRLVLKLKE
jgi:hypothetical protein